MTEFRIFNIDCEKDILEIFEGILRLSKYEDSDFIPLMLCSDAKKIREQGYQCPEEFVFDKMALANIPAALERMIQLRNLFPSGIPEAELKDWCVGAFRRKLYLDEYVHGAGQMNLMPLTMGDVDGIKKWSKEWLQEETTNAPPQINTDYLRKIEEPLQSLFSTEISDLSTAIANFFSSSKDDDELKKLALEFVEAIPKFAGSTVRFLNPMGKLKVLVIDDEKIVPALEGTYLEKNDTNSRLDKYFDFIPLELPINEKITPKKLIEKLPKNDPFFFSKFHIILLDLCINDDSSSDLSGYHLIPVLRKFFPLTPIVIYSSFGDMGHIERAFSLGANWFLKKDEAYKLPRHALALFSNALWRREWGRLEMQSAHEKLKKAEMADYKKYLIASVLRDLPGMVLFNKTPSEGRSHADTLIMEKPAGNLVVVKIDTAMNTGTEQDRYQRFIRPYIDNNAGRIYQRPVILDYERSAITYTYAGDQRRDPHLRTLKEIISRELREDCNYRKIEPILDRLYTDILPKLHNSNIDLDHEDQPNLSYGEDEHILSGYLTRMPSTCEIEVSEFLEDGGTTVIVYGIYQDSKGYYIRGYIHEHEDEKVIQTVKLTGSLVEHVRKYRPMKPRLLHIKVKGKVDKWECGELFTSGLESKNEERKNVLRQKFSNMLTARRLFSESITMEYGNGLIAQAQEAFEEVKRTTGKETSERIMKRIVHGDINAGNIMVDCDSDDNLIGEVWLIDFAKTRRDLLLHDYDVLFSSVLGELFHKDFMEEKGFIELFADEYESFIKHTVFGDRCSWRIQENPRLRMIGKILSRIREAVPDADKATFPYAVALSLYYATRIFLKNKIHSCALLLGSKIIFDEIVDRREKAAQLQ